MPSPLLIPAISFQFLFASLLTTPIKEPFLPSIKPDLFGQHTHLCIFTSPLWFSSFSLFLSLLPIFIRYYLTPSISAISFAYLLPWPLNFLFYYLSDFMQTDPAMPFALCNSFSIPGFFLLHLSLLKFSACLVFASNSRLFLSPLLFIPILLSQDLLQTSTPPCSLSSSATRASTFELVNISHSSIYY